MSVKTRFSPSNTGSLHLGSARTAVFAYAYAKKMGGRIFLRIEDTDASRSTHESLIDILEGLKWLNIEFDDGPKLETLIKFPTRYSKEWFQSKRSEIYNGHIDRLIKEGKAYIDPDGATIFKMPQDDYVVDDKILGLIMFPRSEIKDFPIRRKEGGVLFHFAQTVDDYEHSTNIVIRGNDHLSSAIKSCSLAKALGFPALSFAHMPLILDDKGDKLSKRRTDQFVLIRDFKKGGFLPDSVIHICGLLGWGNPKKTEDITLETLCKEFDIKDCLLNNPRYDPKIALSVNFRKLSNLTIEQFTEKLHSYGLEFYPNIVKYFDEESEKFTFEQFANLYYKRVKTMKEPFINCSFLLMEDKIELQDEILEEIKKNPAIDFIEQTSELISGFDFANNDFVAQMKDFAAQKGVKHGDIIQLIRLCVTMSKVSPPIDQSILTLGKEVCLNRIGQVIEELVIKV